MITIDRTTTYTYPHKGYVFTFIHSFNEYIQETYPYFIPIPHLSLFSIRLIYYNDKVDTVEIPSIVKIENKNFVVDNIYRFVFGDLYPYQKINIKKIKIPYSIKNIHSESIDGLSELEEVEFYGNKHMEEIDPYYIHNKTYRIYSYAFSNCRSLKKIIIPETFNIIEPESFYNCKNLETLLILNPDVNSEKRPYNRDIIKYCDNIKYVAIGNNIIYKKNGSFKIL